MGSDCCSEPQHRYGGAKLHAGRRQRCLQEGDVGKCAGKVQRLRRCAAHFSRGFAFSSLAVQQTHKNTVLVMQAVYKHRSW